MIPEDYACLICKQLKEAHTPADIDRVTGYVNQAIEQDRDRIEKRVERIIFDANQTKLWLDVLVAINDREIKNEH